MAHEEPIAGEKGRRESVASGVPICTARTCLYRGSGYILIINYSVRTTGEHVSGRIGA